jgi:myo-inositol-1(or 4)-monophosphatase
LSACVAGAIRAAEVIKAAEGTASRLDWREKLQSDFVTEVDEAAERALATAITALVPEAVIVGEELTPDIPSGTSAPVFIADPLDGTTNFLHGFPWYAVSIGALRDGELRASAILNVANGEMFTATLGGGARRGGQPIQVSEVTDARRALVGTGFPFKHPANIEPYLASLPAILRGTAGSPGPC